MEGLGKRLNSLRTKHQLSYEEMANELEIDREEIKAWEIANKRPTIHSMKKLAQFYEMDLEDIMPNRKLKSKKMSAILKKAEGGRGTLYLRNVKRQPFFPKAVIKNLRIIEVKGGSLKVYVHNNKGTRYILLIDDVIGFLEEVE